MGALPATDHPAPWTLHGEGIILVYRFSKDFVARQPWMDKSLTSRFQGGLGSVMLVNYTDSPVGPYRELLIIPGEFQTEYGKRRHIPRILVDSQASVEGGRRNWGIPKEYADFTWNTRGRTSVITVQQHKKTLLEAEVKQGLLSLPVSTSMVPIRLYQPWQGHLFLATPRGKGLGRLARIKHLKVDATGFPATGFPEFREGTFLAAFHVRRFTMQMPLAETHTL